MASPEFLTLMDEVRPTVEREHREQGVPLKPTSAQLAAVGRIVAGAKDDAA